MELMLLDAIIIVGWLVRGNDWVVWQIKIIIQGGGVKINIACKNVRHSYSYRYIQWRH